VLSGGRAYRGESLATASEEPVIPLVASFHSAALVVAGLGLSGGVMVIAEPGGARSP